MPDNVNKKHGFKCFRHLFQIRHFFSLLHISFAVHPDFRNWHHFFYDRSVSNKIHALPILIHFGIFVSIKITITLKTV